MIVTDFYILLIIEWVKPSPLERLSAAIEKISVGYAKGESGPVGTIKVATFSLCDREFMCSDSPVQHNFAFTPSSSTFLECHAVEELERVFGVFTDGRKILMPLDNYGFSRRFGWVDDRFECLGS